MRVLLVILREIIQSVDLLLRESSPPPLCVCVFLLNSG